MQFSFFGALGSILASSGFASFAEDPRSLIMIIIACVLLYMGIGKKFEPLLLVPIAFGMLLANLPLTGLLNAPVDGSSPGMLWVFYQGVQHAIYPSIIFLGIGAMTDFGPLIARPSSLLLGAAAQLGIFSAFLLALVLGFPGKVAAAIAIIGGADGPTSILVASQSGSGLSARHRYCGVLVYGADTAYPAADHASADHQEGARGQDGAAASGLQDREDRIPDRSCHHRYPADSGYRSADRHAHAGQPAA